MFFDAYRETPNKPHEVCHWVSGFFLFFGGPVIQAFAKISWPFYREGLLQAFSGRRFASPSFGDTKLKVLLRPKRSDSTTPSFSTSPPARHSKRTLSHKIFTGLFLQSLGYAKDLDLSELEIVLEEKASLTVQAVPAALHTEWSTEKGKVAFALSEASRVLQPRLRDLHDGRRG